MAKREGVDKQPLLGDDSADDDAPPSYEDSEKRLTSVNSVIVAQPVQIQLSAPPVHRPSASWAIVFSCFVLLCCCGPLGIAAFVLAVLSRTTSNYEDAKRQLSLSRKLSLAGLICGLILIPIIVTCEVLYIKAMLNRLNSTDLNAISGNEYNYDHGQ